MKQIWIIIKNHEVLLSNSNSLPCKKFIKNLSPCFLRKFKLDIVNHTEYYCAEIHSATILPDIFKFINLKQFLSIIDSDKYNIAVKAYSIIQWDKNHQFCSRCGSITHLETTEFKRFCKTCDLSFFPRISPSIMVLIKKDQQLLMARSPHFAPGVYALIAGFIEVGESVEDAVHREVHEEVGITITNLKYFGSQAWPFPDSLMIGFIADYDAGEIVIDGHEIEAAGWYNYDTLPGRPSVSVSIASKLIDYFIRDCEQIT